MNIYDYWKAALAQDAENMRKYFHASAYVNWHNTNEQFTLEEFIRANCEYPDQWDGEVERVEEIGDLVISVTHVWAVGQPVSFHAVSFFKITNDRIVSIDEYWGDDGAAPQWRLDKQIGQPIQSRMKPKFQREAGKDFDSHL